MLVTLQLLPLPPSPLLHGLLHAAPQRVLQQGPGLRRQQPGHDGQSAGLGEDDAGEEQDAGAGVHEVWREEFWVRELPGQWTSGPSHHQAELQVLGHP